MQKVPPLPLLRSPRASPKRRPTLSNYYQQLHQFKKGDVFNFQRVGTIIRRAMDCGQVECIILRFLKSDFVPNNAITTPRGAIHGNVTQNTPQLDESLGPLIQWLSKEGLFYRITVPVASNVWQPVYHQYADFRVYWEPRLNVQGGKLIEYWINQKTVKCTDNSFHENWYKMVQRAMDCGQTYAVLMSLFAKSDFSYEPCEFEDPCIRSQRSLAPVKAQVILEPVKFDAVLQWIHEQGLSQFIIVSDEKQPEWAYLCASFAF